MAKIIDIEAYDIATKISKKRYINVDNINEIEDLPSYESKPLSRIRFTNGSFYDTQKSVEEIKEQIQS